MISYNQIVAQVENICNAIREGGGGTNIQWEQLTTSGSHIANIIVDGSTIRVFAPSSGGGGGSSVEWEQLETEGTHIANITIDGNTTEIYAPSSGGGITRTVLYENAEFSTVVTLSESYKNYDLILIEGGVHSGTTIFLSTAIYTKEMLESRPTTKIGLYNDGQFNWYDVTNETTFTANATKTIYIEKVTGIKF